MTHFSLGITKPEEFYKVKLEDIVAQGGSRFLLLWCSHPSFV